MLTPTQSLLGRTRPRLSSTLPDPRSILIVRPSALGDVCRTVPVLASLRRAYPEARIDWLIQDSFIDAIWHHPALTEAIPFARKDLGRSLSRLNPGPLLKLLSKLRANHYDLVLDCQGLARSGFLTWATGARRRVGYSDARELSWLALNRRIKAPASMHTVDRMLELVRGIGIDPVSDMRLYTGPHERAWVERITRATANGAASAAASYAILAPTSRWPAKRWPADRFARVAESLLSTFNSVILVGGPNEQDQIIPLIELSSRNAKVINLVGHTSVAQLMALIQSSSLVIANDSAALHMAVGFDRPSIALFGPTATQLVGPYQKHNRSADSRVIQHITPTDMLDHKDPAQTRLMTRISVEEVLEAAHAMMAPPQIQLASP